MEELTSRRIAQYALDQLAECVNVQVCNLIDLSVRILKSFSKMYFSINLAKNRSAGSPALDSSGGRFGSTISTGESTLDDLRNVTSTNSSSRDGHFNINLTRQRTHTTEALLRYYYMTGCICVYTYMEDRLSGYL